MVASKYGWGLTHMLANFGWKACIGVVFNAVTAAIIFKDELKGRASTKDDRPTEMKPPTWVILTHLVFMGFSCLYSSSHGFLYGAFSFSLSALLR